MMASIRLFGRGKSTAGAGGGTPVSAEQIAAVLEDLRTASMSTTWRCRHGSGTAIGEGAVDFENRRSRATVVRGSSAFEYVRVGAGVFRAIVPEEEVREQLGGAKRAAAGGSAAASAPTPGAKRASVSASVDRDVDEGGDEDVDTDPDELLDDLGDEAEADETDRDETQVEDQDQDEETDAYTVLLADDEDGPGQDAAALDGKDDDEPARAWQSFSEHDACGVHAYAEPAVLAAAVRAAGAVTPAGRKEFDGTVLTGYAVTLKPKPADPDRVLARLARQLRDHGANSLTVTAFVDDARTTPEAVPDFSGAPAAAAGANTGTDTDTHGPGNRPGNGNPAGGGPRVVRLRLELAHWTPADDPTADHSVSVDLFEFGDPVRVEPPAPGSATRRTTRSCADLALF